MRKYSVVVLAYQTVEVDANNVHEAIEKAIEEGIDLSSSEWSTRDIYEINEGGVLEEPQEDDEEQ